MSISNDPLEMEICYGDNHKSACILRYMTCCVVQQLQSCGDATLWCYIQQIQLFLN
jgi:hypothetical protein